MSLLGREGHKSLVTDASPYHDLSFELLATLDPAGSFERLTPSWERTLGYGPSELRSRPFADFVHPDDVSRMWAELNRLTENGPDTVGFESRFRRKDGEYVWLEWRARGDGDGVVHAAVRDVTERRRVADDLERARQKAEVASRAKSEFLSHMSHELRTPLTSVIGFSELVLQDGLADEQRMKVEHVLKAGQHLLALIDELLDISRVEAGTMDISPEPIQVGGLLRDALTLAGPQAAEREVSVSVELDACRDGYVMADPQRLRQVVLNLLSNAIKYNREGGDVKVRCEETVDRTLRIHVSDTGPGLTDEQLSRLFVPFDRLGAEETSIKGTGLGLVLSQRLIELMGGRLQADSELGAGSTFTIELGLTEARRVTEDEPLAAGRSNGGRVLAGRTVLYIEDDLANLELVRQLLGAAGARVLTARDGRSGFSLARQQGPDLILLDLNLPDFAGTQLLTALRHDSEAREIPVIAVSADATRDRMREIIDTGVAAYVTKPFETTSLVESIQQALSLRP